MPRKKNTQKVVKDNTTSPRQKDIARIIIDITDVGTNNLKNYITNKMVPLGLEDQELQDIFIEVEQIARKTKDAGINQLLNLYK